VHNRLCAYDGTPDCCSIADIGFGEIHCRRPAVGTITGQADDVVARVVQPGRDSTANNAAGPGYDDLHPANPLPSYFGLE
jgi:hypothetical protein